MMFFRPAGKDVSACAQSISRRKDFLFSKKMINVQGSEYRELSMEPIMCPFCGGTNLLQEDDYSLETDFEYLTVHHWECLDCAQSFDKIEVLPAPSAFEEMNESTIH